MPEEHDTLGWEETSDGGGPDPLGIIGWEVGGKYKIRAYLGGGGFGEVYEGYNKNLPEQKLVLKFFKRVQSRSKFAKEAKILCLLDHPNISKVIDFLPEEGALVVAHISGRDGGQVLKKSGQLSEDLFLKVARAISSSVAYAHEKKIAHRDLKPGNIMFDDNNRIYLIDFGIAKEIGGDATKTAHQALTPLFAAPERQTGETSYNPFLSDIYELGVTLFNLATDNLPYRNPANPNMAEWGGMASDKFSPELRRILMRATNPDPTKRYQTASELTKEFESLKQAYGGEKKRRGYLLYIAVLAVLVAAGYFGRYKITEIWQNQFSGEEEIIEPRASTEFSETTSEETDQDALIATADTVMTESVTTIDSQTISFQPDNIIPEEKESKFPAEKIIPPADTGELKAEKTTAAVVKPPELTTSEDTAVKPKPAPSMTKLIFEVSPKGKVKVAIDGIDGSPDSSFNVKSGRHNVSIVHPDFPVYKKTANIAGKTKKLSYDLSEIFNAADSVSLQVGLIPPSNDLMIQLTLNGRGNTLSKFPAWDIKRLKGEWQIEAKIYDVGENPGKPKIDSIVVNPYESGSARGVIKGTRGTLALGYKHEEKIESLPMLIFWSKQ